LRRCDLGPVLAPREVFVVRRRQNARTMPINVVVDYLVRVFKEDRALFEDKLDQVLESTTSAATLDRTF
jgi:hypothetical protein